VATEVKAHITGTVWKIEAKPGSKVNEGDTVIILESMKMEIPVIAEGSGTVRAVKIAPADVVQDGDVMLELVLDD